MLMIDFVSWWYSRGWGYFAQTLVEKLRNIADFFSFSVLIRTFFAPFHQISTVAENPYGGPMHYLSVFFDKLLSRTIGAIVRLFILIFGIIAFIFDAILSILLVVIWPILPLAPLICVVLCIAGVAL